MDEPDPGDEATLFPKSAGERLREAREAQGLSLAEIASRTRIPIRQLEAIEAGDYVSLPSPTYAIGFAKAYARTVGLDEVAIAREVRGQSADTARRVEYEPYEAEDTSRAPSGGMVIGGILIAILLLIGVGLWYGTSLFRGNESAPPPLATETPIAPAQTIEQAPAPVTSGQVTLTATDDVWLRIYDATGKTLFESTMKAGDRYDVPSDADRPMINVGRPDTLLVTVNGSNVPPLGDGRVAIKDVGVSAAALAARGTDAVPVGDANADTATPTATPTNTPARSTNPVRSTPAKPKPKPASPTPTPPASTETLPIVTTTAPPPAPSPTP